MNRPCEASGFPLLLSLLLPPLRQTPSAANRNSYPSLVLPHLPPPSHITCSPLLCPTGTSQGLQGENPQARKAQEAKELSNKTGEGQDPSREPPHPPLPHLTTGMGPGTPLTSCKEATRSQHHRGQAGLWMNYRFYWAPVSPTWRLTPDQACFQSAPCPPTSEQHRVTLTGVYLCPFPTFLRGMRWPFCNVTKPD